MMQIFAGLPLASELDLAVTAFRDQGRWQANLQHLPGNPGSNNVVPGVCAEPLAIDDPCAEAPAADVNPAVNAPTFPTHLHHPCHRRVSAACGTRRRCRVCNVRIAHRTVYFHCAHNCRFTVCADCFRPSSRAQTHDACTRRWPHLACVDADPSATRASCVYGRVQLTRYLDMSIEDFVHRVNGLISAGRFADLGIPQVRIEGTTAWGAWLRINCRQGGFGWCPQLLCGVLFHASNRTLTFHGDAVSATSRLLPFFSSWTASTIAELAPPPRVVPPRWILYFMRTLAQLVQLVMGRAVPNHPAPALQSLERYRLQLIQ